MKPIFFAFAASGLALSASSLLALDAPVRTQQMLSPVYSIEKKYRSMEGPSSYQKVYLGDREKPELLWITGVRTEMVGEDGSTPQLPELMCHVNVDLDSAKHQRLFGATRFVSARFMTLSQGMLDAHFPEGYAFPVASNEPLTVYTQVLNHNIENPHIKVRHRVTFSYVRDRDLKKPLKALINVGASGTVLLPQETASLAASVAMPVKDAGGVHGMSCLMAPRAPNAAGMAGDYTDPQGHHLTGHWVVPPGRQVNHSDVTWFMSLPYDTKLHFAAMHLHPFAESIELRDVTSHKVIFKARAQNPAKGVGLTHVDTFSNIEGVPMFKSHKYEVTSVYNNTTNENHDSMASIFLSLDDPEFRHFAADDFANRALDAFDATADTVLLLRTSAGDVGISLIAEQERRGVHEVVSIARSGALDHALLTRSDNLRLDFALPTTLTGAQRALLTSSKRMQSGSGVLLLCAGENGAPVSLAIMLAPSAQPDGRCFAFGRVGPGGDVIRKLAAAPRRADGKLAMAVEILKAEVMESTDLASTTLAPAHTLEAPKAAGTTVGSSR